MSATDSQIMTAPEVRLNKLEEIIQKGKWAFIAVGVALYEVKELKLYEVKYLSWDDYCKNRWGFKRAYADQLIQTADAVGKLPKEIATLVANAKQGRALSSVPESERVQVLEAASKQAEVEGRDMTARDITDAAHPAEKGASDVAIEKQANTPPQVKRTTRGKKVVVELCLDGHGPQRPIKELERIIVLVGFEIAYRCDEDILRLVERWKSLGKFALDEMERRQKMEQRNKA